MFVESLLKWTSCVQLYIEEKCLNWNCETKCEKFNLNPYFILKEFDKKIIVFHIKGKRKSCMNTLFCAL